MGGREIDVVIPVFNGEPYIAIALKSVQSQTLSVSRIIVADDGSTDDTVRVVEALKLTDDRITCLKLPHAGVSAARNAGISASSAPFIAFLDADDIWLPEKLERQMEVFERGGTGTGFVHSSYFFINAQGERLSDQTVVPPKQRGDIFLPLLLNGYVLSGSASSVLVRRNVLDQAGHFDVRLFHGEDWDLWIRLAQISWVDFTPEAVVGIRVHDRSAQRRTQANRELKFFNQKILVLSKWEKLIGDDDRLRKVLRKHICDLARPLLRQPWLLQKFYKNLRADFGEIACSFFPSAIQFWWSMVLCFLRAVWERVKRMKGLNVR